MKIKECEKCGARWIDGQLFWSTGKAGTESDLAGLVCNQLSDGDDIVMCINEKRGDTTGTTWEYRRGYADGLFAEFSRAQKEK